MRTVALATIFLTVAGLAEASACNVTRFRFPSFGSNTATDMHVGSGKPCPIVIRTGGRSTFSAITVSAPARNGTARSKGASAVVYQSRPGYKGPDSFAISVTGSSPSGSGTSIVQVGVVVQ
jgi:hypothetical protein